MLLPSPLCQFGVLGGPAEGGLIERSVFNVWTASLTSHSAELFNNFQMKLILEERRVKGPPDFPVLLLFSPSFLRLCCLPDLGVHEFFHFPSPNPPFAWATVSWVSVTCTWENLNQHSPLTLTWPLPLPPALFLTPLPQPKVSCVTLYFTLFQASLPPSASQAGTRSYLSLYPSGCHNTWHIISA